MQTTNDDETAGTNETNNGSTEDVSRLDGGPIQNENVCSEGNSTSLEEEERNRYSMVEKIESSTKIAISIYEAIEKFVRRDEYSDDLRKELESSIPKYRTLFSKWRKDLEQTDHGIVVAGETSSGKSTLINKILGKNLFKGRLVESTSTICKIRNSGQIKIITTKVTGEIKAKDFSDTCNSLSKECLREIRRYLKERTDLTHMQPDITADFQTVDIGLPVPFLKGTTILVDTPGIGGSGKVTHRLIEYIPTALAFVFVIDASSAGGMQKDRLPKILQTIKDLQKESEMPCFSPENVVFIANKWDLVVKQIEKTDEDSSDSDDENESEIWEQLKSDIKQEWPLVTEEHILKMTLKDVSSTRKNDSTTTFTDFQKILASLVKKAEDLRVVEHLGFLQTILKKILEGINVRKEMGEKSKKEQEKTYEENKKEIRLLRSKCNKFKKEYRKRIKMEVDAIIRECETYMSTEEGKHRILNPEGRRSISDTDWNKTNFEERIKSRLDLYVKNFLRSNAVVRRQKNIAKGIQSFYDQTIVSINIIQNDSVDIHPMSDEETELFTYLIRVGLISSPVWIATLAFGFGIPAAIIGSCAFAVSSYIGWVSKTAKEIDDEYENCKSTVPRIIRTHLLKHFAEPLTQMVEVVAKYLIKRIEAKKTRNNQVWYEREKIVANYHLLVKLAGEISAWKETVISLRNKLQVPKVEEEGVLPSIYNYFPC